jgi:glucokinase
MFGSAPLNLTEQVNFKEAVRLYVRTADTSIFVRNDLQMAAYCELHKGYGKRYKNFCLVSLSTGIGVSPIINNQVLEGKLEIGHLVIGNSNLLPTQCTNHYDCWVSLASGASIEKRYNQSRILSMENVFKNILQDEEIRMIQRYNAQGFGNIINAYDPEAIVITGSMGLSQFQKIIPNAELIGDYTINRPIPVIHKTEYTNNLGLWGAYIFAKTSLSPYWS